MQSLRVLLAAVLLAAVVASAAAAPSLPRVADTDKCEVCEIVVNVIDKAVIANKTIADIGKVVEDLCKVLDPTPGIITKECNLIVDDITKVVAWVTQGITPAAICQKLHLCPARLAYNPLMDRYQPAATTVSPAQMGQFFEGIAEGLVQDVGNLTKCIADAEGTYAAFDKSFGEFKVALARKSKAEVEAAFKDLAVGVADFGMALKDCGVAKLAEDVAAVVKDLEAPQGWLKVLVKDVFKLFKDRKEITADVKEAKGDWEKADFVGSGKAVGRILGLFL